MSDTGKPITIRYTNWRGETADRTIIPAGLVFTSSEWHPEPQWMITAYDVEKKAMRTFALAGLNAPSDPRAAADLAEVEKLLSAYETPLALNKPFRAADAREALMSAIRALIGLPQGDAGKGGAAPRSEEQG